MSQEKQPLPALMFFNTTQARTVEAVTARIIPSGPETLGAREAGALIYIDRALAGAYKEMQVQYREGLTALDEHSKQQHGAPFAELAEPEQDAVLDGLAGTGGGGALGRLQAFFGVLREHTIEGTFCDPLYGGNRDTVGWKLVGFPGAYWSYTEEQMHLGYDAAQLPTSTLEDLRRQMGESEGEGT